jgi:sugar lactone lactonase YvrE
VNDGCVDPAGAFWIGTISTDLALGAGTLRRLAPDGTVDVMVTGVTLSNGLEWTADGTKLYYVDSVTQRIDIYHAATWSSSPRLDRPLARIDPSDGMPDGLTLDAENRVWVALWGGGAIRCLDASGRTVATVSAPASQVTSCAFGGPDLTDLYITSATIGLDSSERAAEPDAGRVFRARPGAQGRSARLFDDRFFAG